jgi:hypothetical protein
MKEKVKKYISFFNSIIYVLSYATKRQLFWSQLKANDVLPCVLVFDYLKHNNYFNFEIIQDVQFKYLDDIIL